MAGTKHHSPPDPRRERLSRAGIRLPAGENRRGLLACTLPCGVPELGRCRGRRLGPATERHRRRPRRGLPHPALGRSQALPDGPARASPRTRRCARWGRGRTLHPAYRGTLPFRRASEAHARLASDKPGRPWETAPPGVTGADDERTTRCAASRAVQPRRWQDNGSRSRRTRGRVVALVGDSCNVPARPMAKGSRLRGAGARRYGCWPRRRWSGDGAPVARALSASVRLHGAERTCCGTKPSASSAVAVPMATRSHRPLPGNGLSPRQGKAATISRYSSSVKARRVSVVTLPAPPTVRATFAAAASSGASLIVTMS
jgi:hypothetical protein